MQINVLPTADPSQYTKRHMQRSAFYCTQRKQDQWIGKLSTPGRKAATSYPWYPQGMKHHNSDLQNHALKIKDQKKKAGARSEKGSSYLPRIFCGGKVHDLRAALPLPL